MKTSVRIINESGKEALALIKFSPENNEDKTLLKKAVDLSLEEQADIDRINDFIFASILSLNKGYQPLEASEINPSFEAIVKVTSI